MIKLINKKGKTEQIITPTKFPDGTSQVWKLLDNVLYCSQIDSYEIVWYYENDGEILQVLQTAELVTSGNQGYGGVGLVMPFLPYGRQDKEISNDSTFGLKTLLRVLKTFPFKYIKTFDAHSIKPFDPELKRYSLDVKDQIYRAIGRSNCDLVCFPDAGAAKRGYDVLLPSFNLEKKRNQSTGAIEGLVCPLPLDLKDKTILIVDDICDGGKTFIEAAKVLYGMGAAHVDLYVTHGIFSNGIHILTELGKLRNIYTTDSILRNVKRAEDHSNLTVFKLDI